MNAGAEVARTAWIRGGAAEDGAAWKEWLHFVVLTPEVEIIANVSMLGSAASRPEGRIIALVRTTEWTGVVERAERGSVRVSDGGRHLQAGRSSVRWATDRWLVRIHAEESPVDIELEVEPVTLPSLARRLPFGGDSRVGWNVVPGAVASGTVRVGDRTWALHVAPTYHDHNFGRFPWGGDFVWEWGAFLPEQENVGSAAVFSRMMDRGRHVVRSVGLMTWADGAYERHYAGAQIEYRLTGSRATSPTRTFPPTMGLCLPTGAVGVPERLQVVATAPGEVATVDVHIDHHARLALPSEENEGETVVIWELTGAATRRLRTRDGEIEERGRAILELVRVL